MDEAKVLQTIIRDYGKTHKAAGRATDHQGILRTIRGLAVGELQEVAVSGINFVNGFLTEDLELKPHDPAYGMTYTLPYPYLPESAGKATRWQQMLVDYWGSDPDFSEKVTALGEVMALTLFAKMTEVQLAVCLYGVGHSGKSRIMEIVQALMPAEAQTSLPPTLWGDKFGPAQLVGKLLNFAGELSETQLIDSAKFKQIVEGAVIEAQERTGRCSISAPGRRTGSRATTPPSPRTARMASPGGGCSSASQRRSPKAPERSSSTTRLSSRRNARLSPPGPFSTWFDFDTKTLRSRTHHHLWNSGRRLKTS